MRGHLKFLKKLKPLVLYFLLFFSFLWIYWLSIAPISAQQPPSANETPKAVAPIKPGVTDPTYGLSGKLGELIAKTPLCTEELKKGCINPNAPRGYFGIPGAPQPNLILAFLWSIWVGWIFSTVGAFGGIMAGVGHISIFGLGNYAKSFKDTNVALNKFLTDNIRTSNLVLVGLSALISTVSYWRMKRLVWTLALALTIGAVGGAYLIAAITAGKISFKEYVGWFGIAVFVVAGFMWYGTTERAKAKRKAAAEAAKKFQEAAKQKEGYEGVKLVRFGLTETVFTFMGVEFKFNPLLCILGGFVIAVISVFLGLGGGFLLVPFMTDIVKLPMFIVAGTSAFVVFIQSLTGIVSYLNKGVMLYWPFIGTELLGIFIGSLIGPRTQKYIPDVWLKRIFVLLSIYVGLHYTTLGFLGRSLVAPGVGG